MNAPVKFRIKGTKVYVDPVSRARASAPAYESASTAARLANWRISSGGPNAAIGSSLSSIRGRSRDVARKNGLADRGLEVLVANVIGTGLKPQFATSDAGLNRELAALWLAWTDESDADGRFDFYGQQALSYRSMLEAGDVFGRLRTRRPGDMDTVPLQIQLLESEFCPVEKTESMGQSGYVMNGIQFDGIGRRVAYWLYREHPNDQNFRLTSGAPVQVPASEIVHMAYVRRPGMIRGEPWLARALLKLYELDQYDDAQLVRQKLAAMFAGFMTPSADGKFGFQDEADEGGVSLAPLEPGTWQILPPGAEMRWNAPPSPGDSYDQFMQQQHRYIAGSMGVLYEQLTGDFSKVNDRTWRAAMNEFKRNIVRLQHQIIVFQFCRPIIRRWAEYAVIANRITLPRGVSVADVARPRWIAQAWPYINPVQDVQASRDEVRAGFTSRAAIVSEKGEDIEVVDAEIAADNVRADGLELRFDSDGRTDMKGANAAEAAEMAAETAKEQSSTRKSAADASSEAFRVLAEASRSQADAARIAAEKPPAEMHMHVQEIKAKFAELPPAPVVNVSVPPQAAPIVNVAAPVVKNELPRAEEPKKRHTRTVVTKHDDKGRIAEFEQEEL